MRKIRKTTYFEKYRKLSKTALSIMKIKNMKSLLSNINFSFIRVAIMSLLLLYSFCCKRITSFICFAVFNVLMIMKTNQNTKIFIC